MKKVVLLCVLAMLAACNTVNGAGEDIQGAGEGVSNTAEKVKDKM